MKNLIYKQKNFRQAASQRMIAQNNPCDFNLESESIAKDFIMVELLHGGRQETFAKDITSLRDKCFSGAECKLLKNNCLLLYLIQLIYKQSLARTFSIFKERSNFEPISIIVKIIKQEEARFNSSFYTP